jgi:hypothetical protein
VGHKDAATTMGYVKTSKEQAFAEISAIMLGPGPE